MSTNDPYINVNKKTLVICTNLSVFSFVCLFNFGKLRFLCCLYMLEAWTLILYKCCSAILDSLGELFRQTVKTAVNPFFYKRSCKLIVNSKVVLLLYMSLLDSIRVVNRKSNSFSVANEWARQLKTLKQEISSLP